MEVSVLASGSSGNCVFVDSGKTKLLFDCGVSGKYLASSLEAIGRNIADINAIVLSHEHTDHISGAGIVSRRCSIPIFSNKKTLSESMNVFGETFKSVTEETEFKIGDITITPVKSSHDAVKPSCFVVENSSKKLGIFTDLGVYDSRFEKLIKNLDCVVLESNHDPEMLRNGRYPEFLKKRIEGSEGHLSNFQASNLVCENASQKLKNVFLAHLSQNNNTPELAYNTFMSTIKHRKDLCPKVHMTLRFNPTRLIGV